MRREEPVFAKNAVHGAAESGMHLRFARFTGEPVFEEAADDPVADGELPDPGTDDLDHAGTIRDRDQWKLLPRAVAALHGEQVAIVQRGGLDPDEHFSGGGLGDGSVDELETFRSVRPLQFETLHRAFLLSSLLCRADPNRSGSRTPHNNNILLVN